MKRNVIWVVLGLVALSVLASYVHRYFVANNDIGDHLPVINAGVIPAIDTDTNSAL